MKIYKDNISGDEMFTDTYPMELIHGVVYQVTAKNISMTDDIDNSLLGANPSAEGETEGTDSNTVSGPNVVLQNRLVEIPFSKKSYQVYIKDYMKAIKTKMTEQGSSETDTFMKGAAAFIKEVLGDFKEYQFFQGEALNPEGMVALCKWDDETPYLYFFKHGLDEEKV